MSKMKQSYAYLFEAHSIQRYVMQGGKLAEMVGASELLELLTGASGPLDDVLAQLKFKEKKKKDDENYDYEFSRRGGGAFFMLFTDREKAESLVALWSLIVPQFAPGLEWNHVIGEGNSPKLAIGKGQEKLRQKRNQPTITLPEVNPLIRRNPRTGLPAVATAKDQDEKIISLDKATLSKLNCQLGNQKNSLLFNKFIELEETKKHWEFPRNLEHKEGDRVFPYKEDNHTIAILHADGNGLGQILMNLANQLKDSKNYATIFYDLSCKIDKATQQAAQQALRNIDEIESSLPLKGGKRILPVRPLILGGDDLTIIIRGDLALDYANDFLLNFEKETEKELNILRNEYQELDNILPKKMTACAGIAFIRSNQPFYLGYHLAESLCGYAKNTSRATESHQQGGDIPASLAFYHVTTTMIDEYGSVQKNELSVLINGEISLLSLGAYGVYAPPKGDEDIVEAIEKELPDFSDLKDLKDLFQGNNRTDDGVLKSNKSISRGPIRHLLTLMHTNTNEAQTAYKRWREVMTSRDKETLKQYEKLCKKLLLNPEQKPEDLPFASFSKISEEGTHNCTFLADLSSWIAIEGEQQ